jgi:hypothetical protein
VRLSLRLRTWRKLGSLEGGIVVVVCIARVRAGAQTRMAARKETDFNSFSIARLSAQERSFLEQSECMALWRSTTMLALSSFKAGQGKLQAVDNVKQKKHKNNKNARRRIHRRSRNRRTTTGRDNSAQARTTADAVVRSLAVPEASTIAAVEQKASVLPFRLPTASQTPSKPLLPDATKGDQGAEAKMQDESTKKEKEKTAEKRSKKKEVYVTPHKRSFFSTTGRCEGRDSWRAKTKGSDVKQRLRRSTRLKPT